MAIFGKKKTEEKKVVKKTEKAVAVVAPTSSETTVVKTSVLIRPHITEKAGIASEAFNVYTFEVSKDATKHTVAHAVESLYKVNPTKVRMINRPAKNVVVRGRKGTKSALKKALVYLKKGDKIEFA